MNLSERYIFGIYEISIVLRETLEYFVNPPKEGFSVHKYLIRRDILKRMTAENTPFSNFCKNNGETGAKIKEQVNNFYNDVYAENSRIVTLVHAEDGTQTLRVEESLFMDLIDYIAGIHETLTDILNGFRQSLKPTKDLEDDFIRMLDLDDRFYRSLVLRIMAMLLNTKFIQFNNAVKNFYDANRDIDPKSGKAFEDPSVKFIAKEMERLFGIANFIVNHSKEHDDEFMAAQKKFTEGFKVYTGELKFSDYELLNGVKPQDMRQFFVEYTNIFSPIISKAHDEYSGLFTKTYNELIEFEKDLRAKQSQTPAEQAK